MWPQHERDEKIFKWPLFRKYGRVMLLISRSSYIRPLPMTHMLFWPNDVSAVIQGHRKSNVCLPLSSIVVYVFCLRDTSTHTTWSAWVTAWLQLDLMSHFDLDLLRSTGTYMFQCVWREKHDIIWVIPQKFHCSKLFLKNCFGENRFFTFHDLWTPRAIEASSKKLLPYFTLPLRKRNILFSFRLSFIKKNAKFRGQFSKNPKMAKYLPLWPLVISLLTRAKNDRKR